MARDNVHAAQAKHIEKLTSTLAAEESKSTFACGGMLGIADGAPTISASTDGGPQSVNSRPITLRFGPDGCGTTLLLPSAAGDPAFEKLLQACDPASFGIGSEKVHDETYRKATKLDPTHFCTDFCPYTSSMVNIINQLLVPSIKEKRSVKAELYNLNVYSGPSGRFKAHVDTPRSESQVGSLVVCLPSAFEGGDLLVRNGKNEVVFDWGASAVDSIQWAAFYSDCEHEVKEVTAGHRITLTYNLYLIDRVDWQAGAQVGLDGTTLPFAHILEAAIADPRFMFRALSKALPRCLKGVDMAIYEACRALTLAPSLITTSKESLSDFYSDCSYEDEYGEEFAEIGRYYPGLKTLEVGGMYGDEMPGEYDNMRSMVEGRFFLLNKPGPKELSMAYATYGNEPGFGCQYTSAAILIKVPSAEERQKQGLFSFGEYCAVVDEYEGYEDDDEDDEDDEAAEDESDEDADKGEDDEAVDDAGNAELHAAGGSIGDTGS